MKEIPFNISVNDQVLHGIEHRPLVTQKTSIIIFLHGWSGYRTGPHDMLVRLARHLCNIGYPSIRFDFRGRGYSQGDKDKIGTQSMLEDLDAILNYTIQKYKSLQIILIGICSGAKLSIYYAKNGVVPIKHVILLSCPAIRQREVATQLAQNEIKYTLSTYLGKISDKKTWIKVSRGTINWRVLLNNIMKPLKRVCSISDKRTRLIKTVSSKPSFQSFSGNILLIYGEKDPETKPSSLQLQELLVRYNIYFELHMVQGANHSFYALAWEAQIIEKIANWLNELS